MTIDFTKYPRTLKLLEISNMKDLSDSFSWVNLNRSEAALELAKLYLSYKLSTSGNPNSMKKAIEINERSYLTTGTYIHSFAKLEAWSHLEIDAKVVNRLYKHVDYKKCTTMEEHPIF